MPMVGRDEVLRLNTSHMKHPPPQVWPAAGDGKVIDGDWTIHDQTT